MGGVRDDHPPCGGRPGWCQARIRSSPVSSPAAPAAGWRVAAAIPVIAHSVSSSPTSSSSQPWVREAGRGRMRAGETGKASHLVTDLGVVFHGARTKGVGAQVDRVLPVGQPGEVGDQVALGHFGQLHRLGALGGRPAPTPRPATRVGRWSEGPRRRPGRGEFEDRRLESRPIQAAPAVGPAARASGPAPDGESGCHRTAFSMAAAKASISARVRRSVTATSRPSSSAPSSPPRRAGRPEIPPRPSGR